MIKAILLDFDGTLVNSTTGIVRTMELTFREMQKPVPSDEEMRATIGMPLRKALCELAHLQTDEEVETAYNIYARLCKTCEYNFIVPFDGVVETLQKLHEKGLRLAIVTSRDKYSTDLIAERHHFNSFIETKVTIDDHLAPKPAPDMVNALLQRMNISHDEAIVIGDTTFDIDMGNSAGCETIAVTYGNHTREQLHDSHPTFIIDSFENVLLHI